MQIIEQGVQRRLRKLLNRKAPGKGQNPQSLAKELYKVRSPVQNAYTKSWESMHLTR